VSQTSDLLRARSQALPAPPAAELIQASRLLDSLAQESLFDRSRAVKAPSYDAALKGRNRGRQSRGGRLVLSWAQRQPGAGDSTLVLEEWELGQLIRLLRPEVARTLSSVGRVHSVLTADAIAAHLGESHAAHPFFAAASSHGGFIVERV
jgi:hypothetical protein